MNTNISYTTLAAARLSSLEAFDAAIREGLDLGAKSLRTEGVLKAFDSKNSSQFEETVKVA